MAFRDFTFPQVSEQLGLRIEDANLFPNVEPFAIRPEIADFVRDGVTLALANSTEKAKSEFIIAPLLLELRRSLRDEFVLFSGVEWIVDTELGLNGYCDFLIGRGRSQHVLQTPFVAIVEAKNDLIRTGLGQCIAAMYAATLANERANQPLDVVYGIVSTGAAWKFLRLQNRIITLDSSEYFVDDLPMLMGILRCVVSVNEPRPN